MATDSVARAIAISALQEASETPEYTAGTGINISANSEISVDNTVIPNITTMNSAIATAIGNAIGNAIGGSY